MRLKSAMQSPAYTTPLEPGQFYHIYNRGNNFQKVFLQPADYGLFLHKWNKFIHPVARTFAYNLLPNHFHALVQIRESRLDQQVTGTQIAPANDAGTPDWVAKGFKNFFISFARTMQNSHGFHGAVFHSPFKRRLVKNESFFEFLSAYIHCNAHKHGLFKGPLRDYPYSSYSTLINDLPTILERDFVLDYFGGLDGFIAFHDRMLLYFDESRQRRA